jgi:hypothetical protein
VSALLFRRHDFREDEGGYFEIITPEQMMDPSRQLDRHPKAALAGKYGLAFLDAVKVPACNDVESFKTAMAADGKYISTTGEISWDTKKGLVVLNSPRTQGVVGFIGREKTETRSLVFEIDSEFGVVLVSSLTDDAIENSSRILLSTSGDARFTGVKISDDFNKIEQTGRFPFLMQPIEGRVTLKTESPVIVYKLSPGGSRTGRVRPEKTSGGYAFELKAQLQAMHYEIVKE